MGSKLPKGAGAVRCSACGTEARADGKGSPIILRHEPDCPVDRDRKDEPLLGLATTRQLLAELVARGEVSYMTEESITRAYDAQDMADKASFLLHVLDPVILDYRTVDCE